MSYLLRISRWIRFIPEVIFLGPALARFLFFSRSCEELDPEAVWNLFTLSGNPIYEWLLRNYPPGFVRKFLTNVYPTLKDRISGIAQHYDISNDFYRLFLDEKYMFYTCADFFEEDETIEDAQDNKANYILNLIDPRPEDRILDLGCGWGGMLLRIYEATGNREALKGYTLSVEQRNYIHDKYRFDVVLDDVLSADYGSSCWDKIYSIGCMEHIPKKWLVQHHQKLATAITPRGKIVHHFFCQPEPTPAARLLAAGADIFPGVQLATLKEHLHSFEAAGLKVVFHSVHDYRPTLAAWFNRLVENKREAMRLVGIKTYNKYLCYLAEAWRLFDDRDLLLMRFVLQPKDTPVLWRSPLSLKPPNLQRTPQRLS